MADVVYCSLKTWSEVDSEMALVLNGIPGRRERFGQIDLDLAEQQFMDQPLEGLPGFPGIFAK